MYALKIITRDRTSSFVLGNEFHIETIERKKPGQAVFTVSGEIMSHLENNSKPPFSLDIYSDMDAYITTMNGKTVHVVNRSGWWLAENSES